LLAAAEIHRFAPAVAKAMSAGRLDDKCGHGKKPSRLAGPSIRLAQRIACKETPGANSMKQNETAALRELRRRAEAGSADAQYELGCKYFEGEGVEQSQAEALKWYRKAAAQGHNSGLCDTGYCYRHGYAVKRDFAKALRYYRQAADQGCPTGAYWLAHAYEHGEGVPRDLELAKKWYRISTQRGDADAPEALARLSGLKHK
jgi:TPR repeat protein